MAKRGRKKIYKDENTLTEKERDILGLMADGLTCEESGQILLITRSTVATYINKIIKKLKAKNKAEAVAIGIRKGIIH